ncbi:MAG: hypothetical protein ACHQEM_12250, partial [Chitinophagales bacterium]
MAKHLYIVLGFFLMSMLLDAQRYYDSLQNALNHSKEDTNRVRILYLLGTYHEATNEDSNYYYIQKAGELADKLDFPKGKFLAQTELFFSVNQRANYVRALSIALDNLPNAEKIRDGSDRLYYTALGYSIVRLVKDIMGDDTTGHAERNMLINKLRASSGKLDGDSYGLYLGKANQFHRRRQEDSAQLYMGKALDSAKKAPTISRYSALCAALYAQYWLELGNYNMARTYFQEGTALADYYN